MFTIGSTRLLRLTRTRRSRAAVAHIQMNTLPGYHLPLEQGKVDQEQPPSGLQKLLAYLRVGTREAACAVISRWFITTAMALALLLVLFVMFPEAFSVRPHSESSYLQFSITVVFGSNSFIMQRHVGKL